MKSNIVITLALVTIAANMTINTATQFKQMEMTQAAPIEEKVVQVLGRYHVSFDGYGNTPGFVVINDGKLEVAPFDSGSMVDVAGWTPKYLIKYGSSYHPIVVETDAPIPVER